MSEKALRAGISEASQKSMEGEVELAPPKVSLLRTSGAFLFAKGPLSELRTERVLPGRRMCSPGSTRLSSSEVRQPQEQGELDTLAV